MKIYGKFKGKYGREKAFVMQKFLLSKSIETYITREFINDISTPWYFVKGEQK